MNLKEKIITFIICLLVICVYVIINRYENMVNKIDKVYNVYLNGEIIGVINDKDELYALINEKQQAIKDTYSVNSVYPPNTLNILESYSYNSKIDTAEEVYSKIENSDNFAVFGYEVKISSNSDNNKKDFSIYVLDKEIFYDALRKFVLSFVPEEDYNNYIEGTNKELDDIGMIYTDMNILENIVIREKYINTNSKIYQSSDELAQELLFGFNYNEKTYVIREGDTIESISEDNKLNTQEFLIANPKYTSKDSLLAIGDKVNITFVNPELSFKYTVSAKKQVEYDFDKLVQRDSSKPIGYSEITTPGVKGISLITSHYEVVNGEQNSEEIIDSSEVIRAKVDQVTTKGKTSGVFGWMRYEDTGSGWRWPTDNPYTITSQYGYRNLGSRKIHQGIDISGSGFGSRIYATNDGVVVYTNNTCADIGYYGNNCGHSFGNYVIIDHGDNIFTVYAHITSRVLVSVGQRVSRGTVVGYMGSSGSSTGTHLHFALSIGDPYKGGTYQNPKDLFK